MLAAAVLGDEDSKDKMTEYCNGLTAIEAMDPVKPQLSGMRKEDSAGYRKSVSLALLRMTEIINVTNTLSTDQIDDLITRIGSRFYFFRFDELLYVLEKAINNDYGKAFNLLDASVVMSWLESYDVNERTPQAIELASRKTAPVSAPLNDDELRGFYKKTQVKVENPFVDNSDLRIADHQKKADQDYYAFRREYQKKQQEAREQQELRMQAENESAKKPKSKK